MISKPVRPGPRRSCASASSDVAAASVGSDAIAVATAAGRGCSFSVAAVMIAERAFAADQEVAQVVAGVVLAQARQAVPDAPLGGDDLEAEALLARVAVADDLRAAGVGREVAADRAAALGGEAEREQQAALGRSFLHALQHAAGLGDERQVGGVDAANAVQPRRRQHHLASAGVGHRAADEPGVAALGDDRRAVGATGLRRRPRPRRSSPGRTTASARPWKRRRQSTSYGAPSSPTSTCAAPTAARRSSSTLIAAPRRPRRGGVAASSTRGLMAAPAPRRRGRRRRAGAPGCGCSRP